MTEHESTSFGVFKPVGHVVISFASAAQADAAARALHDELGMAPTEIRRFSDREMITQIDHDLAQASPLAAIGQELNLVKAHRALAERGYHWLVVPARADERAEQVAACVRPHGAERAQHYGHFIIVELIEHATDLPQVGESPDRALDAQTPSGTEAERDELRRREDEAADPVGDGHSDAEFARDEVPVLPPSIRSAGA